MGFMTVEVIKVRILNGGQNVPGDDDHDRLYDNITLTYHWTLCIGSLSTPYIFYSIISDGQHDS